MLTLHDLASRLNISYATARRLVLTGEVRGHRVGRQYRISEEAVRNYLSETVVDRDDEIQLVTIPALRYF